MLKLSINYSCSYVGLTQNSATQFLSQKKKIFYLELYAPKQNRDDFQFEFSII